MNTKNIIFATAVVAVVILGGFGYWYFATPAKAPTDTAENTVNRLEENGEGKVYSVVSAQSKATYQLGEELRGVPTVVTGTTADIAGDVVVSGQAEKQLAFGEIRINARTFKTDIAMRDENVRKLVLKADEPANEFIVFKPSTVITIPAGNQGEPFNVSITGDAIIAGVTKPVTFTGTASVTDQVVTVNASSMVTYGDFGVVVPNFSFLANVDKTVKLSIELTAK